MGETYKKIPVLLSQQVAAKLLVSASTGSEASGDDVLSSDETTEVDTEIAILQNMDANITTITNLSTGLIIAMGLLIGVNLGKIFFDKIWR